MGGSLLYTPSHGQIRLPGTFVAPWQWGWFLISSAFSVLAPPLAIALRFGAWMGLYSMVAVFVMASIWAADCPGTGPYCDRYFIVLDRTNRQSQAIYPHWYWLRPDSRFFNHS